MMTPTYAAKLAKFVMMAYFTSWSPDTFTPFDIPAKCLTHVTYAFANISNGVVVNGAPDVDIEKLFDNPKWQPGQPKVFKGAIDALTNPKGPVAKCNPNLKYIISVGGWTFSSQFSIIARTPEARRKFARSLIRYCHRHHFHGVDLDWEYPGGGGMDGNASSPDDKENFVKLLEEIRREMGRYQKKHKLREPMLLTAATGINSDVMSNLDIPEMDRLLDWFNLMIYDFAGSWDNVTTHNAPLPGFIDALNGYLKDNAHPSKLVTGIPLYADVFRGVKQQLPGAPFASVDEFQPTFDDIQKNFTADKGYQRFWDPEAHAEYLYNQGNETWVTFEDPKAVLAKARYVLKNGFRGMFFWELSNDVHAVLLRTASKGLGIVKKSYFDCFC